MSTELNIIKDFVISLANVGVPISTDRVLVLKINHELLYLDPCDRERCLERAMMIKAEDNVHRAWKYFDSHAAMELFIKERRARAATSTVHVSGSNSGDHG